MGRRTHPHKKKGQSGDFPLGKQVVDLPPEDYFDKPKKPGPSKPRIKWQDRPDPETKDKKK